VVFTALSQDVVIHEMTHALLDGLRAYFMVPTNPDVAAFHEGFADLVAVFQRFQYRELLVRAFEESDEALTSGLLTDIARQFGRLRDGATPPAGTAGSRGETRWHAEVQVRPGEGRHALGGVVAAVFDAFRWIFEKKTAARRLARNHDATRAREYADLLATEASLLASQFTNVIVRAIDYCPPVDVTLGEYLRALVTADWDLVPDDPWCYREALVQGFRRYGVTVPGVADLSEDALRWSPPERPIPPVTDLAFARLRFDREPGEVADPGELTRRGDLVGRLVTQDPYYFGLAPWSRLDRGGEAGGAVGALAPPARPGRQSQLRPGSRGDPAAADAGGKLDVRRRDGGVRSSGAGALRGVQARGQPTAGGAARGVSPDQSQVSGAARRGDGGCRVVPEAAAPTPGGRSTSGAAWAFGVWPAVPFIRESPMSAPATASAGSPAVDSDTAARAAWQLKLLPLMGMLLTVASVAFLVVSLVQTNRVRALIEAAPSLELPPEVDGLSCIGPGLTAAQQQACVRWKVLVKLEAYTIARRYHQANAALVVRAWIKYLGFLTGMILAIVGAVFILGRLTEASSQLAAEGTFGKFSSTRCRPAWCSRSWAPCSDHDRAHQSADRRHGRPHLRGHQQRLRGLLAGPLKHQGSDREPNVQRNEIPGLDRSGCRPAHRMPSGGERPRPGAPTPSPPEFWAPSAIAPCRTPHRPRSRSPSRTSHRVRPAVVSATGRTLGARGRRPGSRARRTRRRRRAC
jgi:hypothetical protein